MRKLKHTAESRFETNARLHRNGIEPSEKLPRSELQTRGKSSENPRPKDLTYTLTLFQPKIVLGILAKRTHFLEFNYSVTFVVWRRALGDGRTKEFWSRLGKLLNRASSADSN